MAEKYGNLPLGQAYKLIISIIGRDAALYKADSIPITGDDLNNIYNENEKTNKKDNRKESRSLIHLKPGEKTNPLELVRNFFDLLEKPMDNEKGDIGYEIPKYIKSLIIGFFEVFRDALKILNPFEMPTKDIVIHLLYYFLGSLELIYKIPKDSAKKLLKDTYNDFFNELINITGGKKYFRSKIEPFFEDHDIIQSIKRYRNGSSNMTWKKLLSFLNFIKFEKIIKPENKREFTQRLIGLYLLKNTETALKDICGIKDTAKIKMDVLLQENGFHDLSILQHDFIDKKYKELITSIQDCLEYLWGKNTINNDKAMYLISGIDEKKHPNYGNFFVSWAYARLAVLSCKFDNSKEDQAFTKIALRNYKTAFDEGRNFAGAYLKDFLEEAITVTAYFNRKHTKDVLNVIKGKSSKMSPLTKDAKRYFEYGCAIDLFSEKEKYYFHNKADGYFWWKFPVSAFINYKAARQKESSEFKSRINNFNNISMNVFNEKINSSADLNKCIKKLQNILNNPSDINKHIKWSSDDDILYTPLTIALRERKFEIAKKYLDNNSIDVTAINSDSSTALTEGIYQYKILRFLEKKKQKLLSKELNKLKEIIRIIIEHSHVNALYAETNTDTHISILQEAINSYDIEIVKNIVNKKGFDIQKKISTDKETPLDYAKQRLDMIDEQFINNINYATMEKTARTLIIVFIQKECGDQSTWEDQKKGLKEIIDYLKTKTNI
jgi:hypothetical protein